MRALLLLLLAAPVLADTTMTPPLSNGGWEGWRGEERVGPPAITLERCWHHLREDAQAGKASALYRCTYTWRREILYTAPPPPPEPATVTLRLAWQPVERDQFGRPLLPGDVTAYRIRYGTEPGTYTQMVEVPGDVLSHELVLAAASYYLTVSAVAWGEESALSAEVTKGVEP